MIRNWLKVMPYSSTNPEILYMPSLISDISTGLSLGK
jgi:hypothetical protein